jgi:hypothetical protein
MQPCYAPLHERRMTGGFIVRGWAVAAGIARFSHPRCGPAHASDRNGGQGNRQVPFPSFLASEIVTACGNRAREGDAGTVL